MTRCRNGEIICLHKHESLRVSMGYFYPLRNSGLNTQNPIDTVFNKKPNNMIKRLILRSNYLEEIKIEETCLS